MWLRFNDTSDLFLLDYFDAIMMFYFSPSSLLVPQSGSGLPSHVFSSRSYFFDNPRRYDSDDDLAWSVMPQNIQAR